MTGELNALKRLKNGDMEEAHRIVQELDTRAAFWIHAVIHKVEGDMGNARYWYGRAGVSFTNLPLSEEIEKIEAELGK